MTTFIYKCGIIIKKKILIGNVLIEYVVKKRVYKGKKPKMELRGKLNCMNVIYTQPVHPHFLHTCPHMRADTFKAKVVWLRVIHTRGIESFFFCY